MAWLILWGQHKHRVACLLLLLAIGATGGGWHHLHWTLFAADDLGCFTRPNAQPVYVEALVEKGSRRLPAVEYDPMRIIPRGDRTVLEVRLEKIRDGVSWRSVSGQTALLVDGHLLDVRAGDRVRVEGARTGNGDRLLRRGIRRQDAQVVRARARESGVELPQQLLVALSDEPVPALAGPDGERIAGLLSVRPPYQDSLVTEVIDLVRSGGYVDRALEEAAGRVDSAQQAVAELPGGDAKDILSGLGSYLLGRVQAARTAS